MYQYLKSKIGNRTKTRIKDRGRQIISVFISYDLTLLAKLFKTDKWGAHFYTPHYQNHLRRFKFKRVKLLEIGVGGYDDPFAGANSLRMWKAYFPFGRIFSIDIFDKSPLQERRIKIFQGSQIDQKFLDHVVDSMGDPDIVVDDGSHINEHVIRSFEYLFPKLKNGGIYVIEDTQTSYWPNYGGSSSELNKQGTIYHYFKGLIDGLNYSELLLPGYQPNYFDLNITSIHFYHNLIFVYKGFNDESSNYLVNNKVRNA